MKPEVPFAPVQFPSVELVVPDQFPFLPVGKQTCRVLFQLEFLHGFLLWRFRFRHSGKVRRSEMPRFRMLRVLSAGFGFLSQDTADCLKKQFPELFLYMK